MTNDHKDNSQINIAHPMSFEFDIHGYDYYLIMFSGGKDSTACLLHLLDLGIPKHRIELWHQLMDGKES
ncbi:hypothetical protein CCY01nite_39340 [Chitinophaga cymbidii]|uniref:Phosphoadenosine phosphosulphate reductase domain-containing protein n=1 Tax=Chitinophaga cymbidii TaxID=1096750 RepID=A0A512RPS0_9BACT|nr:hypothetical protein CCY01nite_39340 [Chitinophaga cymbidii]